MQKLFVLALLLTGIDAFGQKPFQLTIYIDSSIDKNRLSVYCQNGYNHSYSAEFIDNKSVMSGKFYSKYADVTISYNENDSTSYYHQFWISDKPASIRLTSTGSDIFENAKLKNCIDIFKENKRAKAGLNKFTKDEVNAISEFWSNVETYQRSGTFESLRRERFVSLLNRSSEYIRQHNDNYFLFWYFVEQFYGVARTSHKNDTALHLMVKDSLLSIFPQKFIERFETKKILDELENDIHPKITTNTAAPHLKAATINGDLVDLADYKGKYVLLEFWATWCPPCMKKIPFIKSLRSKYGIGDLEIVSISLDKDSLKMRAAVEEYNLNWAHIFDNDYIVGNMFYVKSIPYILLIDEEGTIVYQSSGAENHEKIIEILDGGLLKKASNTSKDLEK